MKLPKLKFGDAVEVLWEDAWGTADWVEKNQPDVTVFVREIGYFWKVTDKALVLCGGTSESVPDSVLTPSYIPLGMVRKVRRLKI